MTPRNRKKTPREIREARREQQHARREKKVRRLEIPLRLEDSRDQYLSDFLDSLPKGTISAFLRQAVEEKIAREVAPDADNSDLREMLLEALARLEELRNREPVIVETVQAVRVRTGERSDDPPEVQSSGLDMGRPRPRKTIRSSKPLTLPEADGELTEAQQIEYAQIFAKSVMRANPGMGE